MLRRLKKARKAYRLGVAYGMRRSKALTYAFGYLMGYEIRVTSKIV